MSRSRDLERQGKKDRDFVDFVDFIDLVSGSENKQINLLISSIQPNKFLLSALLPMGRLLE